MHPSGCTVASNPTQRASGAMQCAHPAGAGPGGPRSAAHRCRSHVFSAVEWILQSYDATSIPSARFLAQPPSSLLVHSGLVESLVGEPGRARGARPVSQVLLRWLLRLRGGVRLACGGGAEGVPHRRGLWPCTRHLRPRVCGALQALPWSVSCRVLWSAWGALFCGAARRSVRPAAGRGLVGLFSLLRMLRVFLM